MQTPKLLRVTPGPRTGNVRLGETHAYGFSGDHVRLDAELLVAASAKVDDRDWALQLWACAEPFDGHAGAGTLVAQVPIGPLSTESQQYVGAEGAAFPPAGHGTHTMVLVLADGNITRDMQHPTYNEILEVFAGDDDIDDVSKYAASTAVPTVTEDSQA